MSQVRVLNILIKVYRLHLSMLRLRPKLIPALVVLFLVMSVVGICHEASAAHHPSHDKESCELCLVASSGHSTLVPIAFTLPSPIVVVPDSPIHEITVLYLRSATVHYFGRAPPV